MDKKKSDAFDKLFQKSFDDLLKGAPNFDSLETISTAISGDSLVGSGPGSVTQFMDDNNVSRLSLENGNVVIRDPDGELIVSLGEEIKIGAHYKDHPLPAARAFLEAVSVLKAFS